MTIEPLLKINSAAGNSSDDTVEFYVIAIGDSDKVSEALKLTMPEVPAEDRRLTLRGVIRYRDAFNNSFETYFGFLHLPKKAPAVNESIICSCLWAPYS